MAGALRLPPPSTGRSSSSLPVLRWRQTGRFTVSPGLPPVPVSLSITRPDDTIYPSESPLRSPLKEKPEIIRGERTEGEGVGRFARRVLDRFVVEFRRAGDPRQLARQKLFGRVRAEEEGALAHQMVRLGPAHLSNNIP